MKDRMQLFWYRLADWSEEAFGPDSVRGPIGPLKHLTKEIDEVLEVLQPGIVHAIDRNDLLEEFADLQHLVFDACRRAGFSYRELVDACHLKQLKNRSRTWPDWRAQPTTVEPMEHDRSKE